MNAEQQKAYEWAKNQNYQSVAAQYARLLAGALEEKIHSRPISENKTLTIEQIQQMNGKPVWVVGKTHLGKDSSGTWALVHIKNSEAIGFLGTYKFKGYGKTWLAYTTEPIT